MRPAERTEFGQVMAVLAEYYGRTMTRPLTELYWRGLVRYDLADVKRAGEAHMRDTEHGVYMPKIADFVRHIDGSTETRAQQAWTKVTQATRRAGAYATVVFDDWRIHRAIQDMGGWVSLCHVEHDELPFKAREFEKRYAGLKDGHSYPLKLTGIAEAHNERNGYGVGSDIVFIGDHNSAAKVLAGGTHDSGVPVTPLLTHEAQANG